MTKVLQASKHALDDISVSIFFLVKRVRSFPVDLVCNDRLDTQLLEPCAIVVRTISLVGQQIARIGQMIRQHYRAFDIGGLTGCQIKCQRTAMGITYGVYLGVAPAFCEPNRLNIGPPFPPPAHRWTFTWVLSMDISSSEPAKAEVNSRNIYCQIPFCDQRL